MSIRPYEYGSRFGVISSLVSALRAASAVRRSWSDASRIASTVRRAFPARQRARFDTPVVAASRRFGGMRSFRGFRGRNLDRRRRRNKRTRSRRVR